MATETEARNKNTQAHSLSIGAHNFVDVLGAEFQARIANHWTATRRYRDMILGGTIFTAGDETAILADFAASKTALTAGAVPRAEAIKLTNDADFNLDESDHWIAKSNWNLAFDFATAALGDDGYALVASKMQACKAQGDISADKISLANAIMDSYVPPGGPGGGP